MDLNTIFQTFLTIFCSVLASSGFWAWLSKKNESKDAKTRLLIGLAHDRICYLGAQYIGKKQITKDEYENLHDYLYVPYLEIGGNGTATRVMKEVDKLEIV